MFSTCMFCNRPLGTNAVVETFPVGRRLAFDAKKGRLWVVCGKCERWNLSPIEERWEAVEALEAIFRGTRIRVSSENIGMAKHPEGLELVRIGEPLRPEFAAWRYGDQFGRRRRRAILYGVGGAVVVGGVIASGVAAGVISGAVLGQSGNFVSIFMNGRTLAKVKAPDGTLLKLKRKDLERTRLEIVGNEWELVVGKRRHEYRFTGEDAQRTAATLVSRINRTGAGREAVQSAVRRLDEMGSPDAVLRAAAEEPSRRRLRRGHPAGRLSGLPAPTRLAVEMALHEEQERRALEGELWLLERRWKEAEEIAAISDSLLLPEGTDEFLEKHRAPGAG
ncbi:MAG TPA: hypothetical protein VLH75_09035 [Longimicrobiales bacterium]|nr:hypothetical protein [Longimicrobiales bacterium]